MRKPIVQKLRQRAGDPSHYQPVALTDREKQLMAKVRPAGPHSSMSEADLRAGAAIPLNSPSGDELKEYLEIAKKFKTFVITTSPTSCGKHVTIKWHKNKNRRSHEKTDS